MLRKKTTTKLRKKNHRLFKLNAAKPCDKYRFACAYSSINEAAIIFNKEFILEGANEYFYRIFGYRDKHNISLHYLFDNSYLQEAKNVLAQELFKLKNIDSFNSLMRTENGEILSVDIRAAVFMDADNREKGVLAIRHSVDTSFIDRELSEGKNLDRSIFKYANVPIFIWNSDGLFLDANAKGFSLLDYSREYLSRYTIKDVFPNHHSEIFSQLQNKRVYQGEVLFMCSGKKHRHLELSVFAITPNMNTYYYGIAIDITERKELELLKEDHFHLINHDLKTPLTAILGYCEILQMEFDNPAIDKMHFINEIHEAGRHMMEMLVTLQDIHKLENNTLNLYYEDIDLLQILFKAIRNIQLIAEKKRLTVEIRLNDRKIKPDDNISIQVDSTQFLRVCNNIVKNAAESAFPNTRISIFIMEKVNEIEIRFQNYGVPIPEEVQYKIFNKFSTFGKKSGMGLGTYGIKLITEAHKAKVFLKSHDQLTEFILLYPKKKP